MNYPSPEDPSRAPVWENYVVAQVVQASLGSIPEHALAVGAEVTGRNVRLRFQLTELTERDREDMVDIAGELEALVGPDVRVELVQELRQDRVVSPHDGVLWIFLKRS
jgi:hypothetical protein